MRVKAYVLVETHPVIKTSSIVLKLVGKEDPRIKQVETVTGPFSLIVIVEGDLDNMEDVITNVIQGVPGVIRTTTCLVVKLG